MPSAATAGGRGRAASRVRATKGASFMEVRAGSAGGEPLFTGTLERGQTQALHVGRAGSRSRRRGNVVVRSMGTRQGAAWGQPRGPAPSRERARAPRSSSTGSELVRGERTDLNGPFFAPRGPRARSAGGAHQDRRRRPRRARGGAAGRRVAAEVCLVSGGLGPTHDDRTIELVARVAGRACASTRLEAEIEEISRRSQSGCAGRTPTSLPGFAKQATLPEGRSRSGRRHRTGRRSRHGRMRRRRVARAAERAAAAVAARARDRADTGVLARTLARATGAAILRRERVSGREGTRRSGGDGDGVEATICARDFEIHVDLVVKPGAEERADVRGGVFCAARTLFGRDERSVQELVLDLCRGRGFSWRPPSRAPEASSQARLTSIAGLERRLPRRCRRVRRRGQGRLSACRGTCLRTRRGVGRGGGGDGRAPAASRCDVGVAVTGIAGPGGGTEEKPVGLVSSCGGPDGRAWRCGSSFRATVAGSGPR